jgi:hypothetical protein
VEIPLPPSEPWQDLVGLYELESAFWQPPPSLVFLLLFRATYIMELGPALE